MPEPRMIPSAGAIASAPMPSIADGAGARPSIPEQYELLLAKLAGADADFASAETAGRSAYLEEASGIVFDLLYSLDFRQGGELVPRLAALYGYIANQLLAVAKTKDRVQLAVLRDMVASLRHSCAPAENVA